MKQLIQLLTLFFAAVIMAQTPGSLRFNRKGEFKILQLTDIHWSGEEKFTSKTAQTITALLKKEKPDFIVLTGDNVNCIPMKKGWDELSKVLIAARTPWTAVFGNHDAEQNWTNAETMAYLQTLPYFTGERGPVTGDSNFVKTIYDASGASPRANLFFLDSGAYTGNPLLGHYAWIRQDQVHWYAEESRRLAKTQGKILPGLMFFHIPLQEYAVVAKKDDTVGNVTEDVSSSDVNSGMFAALLEQKNVMATFTGHDHNNNFVGIHQGIALAYGNKTGADGYGELPGGGRVVVLKENQFSFTTYITTPEKTSFAFNFPSGLTPIDSKTNVLKASQVKQTSPGLHYTYLEGNAESTADLSKMKTISTGIISVPDLSMAKQEDHFGIKFEGYINVPETAYYKFYTYSDDGSVLKIDNQIIVENDGGHSARRREGIVALEKGLHKFELLYFEDYMGQTLDVGVSSINMAESSMPAAWLSH